MSERSTKFVYLPVEDFRKLTPQQKQEHVEALKQHFDIPLQAFREDQSNSPEHQHP